MFLVSPITHYNFSSLITPHRDYIDQSASELEEFNKNKPLESGDESGDEKPSYFIHSSHENGGEYDSWPMAMGESARCCCPPPTLWSPSSTPPLSLLPQPKVSKAP